MNCRYLRRELVPLLLLGLAGCPQPALNIEPPALPNAVQGRAYSAFLNPAGADAPVRWEITDGALPPGLALEDDTGEIFGVPVEPGSFDFIVLARERALGAQSGSRSYQLIVIPTLTVSGNLANARVGVAYNAPIAISGGVPPYQVTVIGLPGGLALDQNTDSITGTPLLPNDNIPLAISVVDSGNPQQTAASNAQLVIDPPPVSITTTELPDGQVGTPYSAQLAATGGTPAYQWGFLTAAPGTLPPGLNLNTTTGLISGTPSAVGTSTVTIRVVDSDVPITSDTQELSITITQ